jgi:hypothetical protein
MGFYTGRTGAMYFYDNTETNFPAAVASAPEDSKKVVKLRDWSIETSLELLETTTIDTAVKSYTPGMVSATGSATVLYYRTEVGEVGKQFDKLLNNIMKTSTAGVTTSDRCGFILRAGLAAGTGSDIKDDIAFNAYITSASVQVGTGELTSVAIQFTVDGPFVEIIDN